MRSSWCPGITSSSSYSTDNGGTIWSVSQMRDGSYVSCPTRIFANAAGTSGVSSTRMYEGSVFVLSITDGYFPSPTLAVPTPTPSAGCTKDDTKIFFP